MQRIDHRLATFCTLRDIHACPAVPDTARFRWLLTRQTCRVKATYLYRGMEGCGQFLYIHRAPSVRMTASLQLTQLKHLTDLE